MTNNDDDDDNAYLWDKSGPVDAAVAAFERSLAPLSARATGQRPAPSAGGRRAHVHVREARAARMVPITSAAFSALALAAAVVVAVWAPPAQLTARAVGDGARVNGVALAGAARVDVGARIEGNLVVELGVHGIVTLEDGARARIVKNAPDGQELALEQGALSALVDAPPRFFAVTAPGVRAVDLGCAYRIVLEDDGAARVTVTSGAVVLEAGRTSTYVPAGASAKAPRGLPYRTDASAAMRAAADADDAVAALERASAGDGITAWHAAKRASDNGDDAGARRALAKLREIAPPPRGVTDAQIAAGDVDALFRWLDDVEAHLDPAHPQAR